MTPLPPPTHTHTHCLFLLYSLKQQKAETEDARRSLEAVVQQLRDDIKSLQNAHAEEMKSFAAQQKRELNTAYQHQV